MAVLNDNVIHLTIDGADVCTKFVNVDFNESNSTQDVTAGCGTDHVQRRPGLTDTSMSITLVYDVDTVPTYIQKMKTGVIVPIEYGPEGSGSGKPRHLQNFIFDSVAHSRNVNKAKVEFNLNAVGADAPTHDMHAGAVFP